MVRRRRRNRSPGSELSSRPLTRKMSIVGTTNPNSVEGAPARPPASMPRLEQHQIRSRRRRRRHRMHASNLLPPGSVINHSDAVLGSWVGARRPVRLSLFLAAPRVVLPKILVLTAPSRHRQAWARPCASSISSSWRRRRTRRRQRQWAARWSRRLASERPRRSSTSNQQPEPATSAARRQLAPAARSPH